MSVEAATADLTRAFQESYRKQLALNPRATSIEIAKPRVIVASMLAQRGPNQGADTKVATWLLGVAGITIVGHGRSGSKAVRNAIAMAYRFASGQLMTRLEREIAATSVSHQ